jgi:hypothetical protein
MPSMQFEVPETGVENGLPLYHFHVADTAGLPGAGDLYLVIENGNLGLTETQVDTVAAAVTSALEAISGVTSVTQTEIWYTDE